MSKCKNCQTQMAYMGKKLGGMDDEAFFKIMWCPGCGSIYMDDDIMGEWLSPIMVKYKDDKKKQEELLNKPDFKAIMEDA